MKIIPKLKRTSIVIALAFVGCWASFGMLTIENIPATFGGGGQGTDCPGSFTGFAIMTNSLGGCWITPPAGTTNAILTDVSGFPAPYASVTSVMRRCDLMTWCANTSVSFPVTNGDCFQLKLYVVSSPAPTNGPLVLLITWQ
jgi:hypothetical protein